MNIKDVSSKVKPGTHIPMLIRIFDVTEGDILELGSGYFSTTVLRWLCEMSGRTLYSVESTRAWYEKALRDPVVFHKVIKCNQHFSDVEEIFQRKWSMVLVDHFPDTRRYREIERLATKAEYLIIHDSNLSEAKNYGYEKIWHLFKYRYDYTKLNPNTTVVSNFHNLSFLKD
jgi:hypothetical protein